MTIYDHCRRAKICAMDECISGPSTEDMNVRSFYQTWLTRALYENACFIGCDNCTDNRTIR